MLAEMSAGTEHPPPLLSVIIVNYNTRHDLERCLDSLMHSELFPPPEVIVVDNASQDGSAEMVRHRFPAVRLLALPHNVFFCRGNNIGLESAHGLYALLLNPDTVVPPDALSRLVQFMHTHPAYAGATLQLRYPPHSPQGDTVQRTCSRIPTLHYLLLTQTALRWLPFTGRRAVEAAHVYAGWERDCDYDVEAIPGSCTLMRRSELRLDDDLLLYFPEDDLARRTAPRKFRFLAHPPIEHREKAATRSAVCVSSR
jgi:hypothetical protein